MDKRRREFVGKAASVGAAGAGAAALAALLATPQEAAAQPSVELAPAWRELELGRTYRVTAPVVVVTAIIRRKDGDFRGAIEGKVDGQVRGTACAGWSPPSGMSTNSFQMFANRGQNIEVNKIDDQDNKYGRNWEVSILVSGRCDRV